MIDILTFVTAPTKSDLTPRSQVRIHRRYFVVVNSLADKFHNLYASANTVRGPNEEKWDCSFI